MRRTLPLTALALLAGACVSEPTEITVNHYRIPCVDNGEKLCLLVKQEGSTQFTRFIDDIEGYTPKWGQIDTLSVIKTIYLQTGTSGPSAWELVEVIDSETVAPGTTFPFRFDLGINPDDTPFIAVDETQMGGTLYDGSPYVCETQQVCDSIKANLPGNGILEVQFRYGDPITEPFIAWNALFQAAVPDEE